MAPPALVRRWTVYLTPELAREIGKEALERDMTMSDLAQEVFFARYAADLEEKECQVAKNNGKIGQTELPLGVEPKVQDCLDTIRDLKHKVLKLSDVKPPPPVRLATEQDEQPLPAPDPAKREARRVPLQSPAVRPWEGMDPYAPRDMEVKVPLNEYQRTLLASLAVKDGGSQRRLAARLLVEVMEQRLGLKQP